MDKSHLEALLTTLDHWTAFFAFLVVIGVGGEFVVHILYSRGSGRLIALQHTEEQQLQAEISKLSSTTAEANKVAAQANERAKQMEVRAEELRNENLELQRRINPRFLTKAQQAVIRDGIQPYRGHPIIVMRLGDGEAGPYGDSIIALFEEAGWVVQKNYAGIYVPPTYGIICRVSAHPDAAIRALVAAFKTAKIELTLQEVAAQQDSWVDMLVGLKPPA